MRTRTMMGFDAPYVPGWDCHGLPIEHKVDRELGTKKLEMSDIEIRAACRAYAEKYVGHPARRVPAPGRLRHLGRAVPDDVAALRGRHRRGSRQGRGAGAAVPRAQVDPLVLALPDGAGRGGARVPAAQGPRDLGCVPGRRPGGGATVFGARERGRCRSQSGRPPRGRSRPTWRSRSTPRRSTSCSRRSAAASWLRRRSPRPSSLRRSSTARRSARVNGAALLGLRYRHPLAAGWIARLPEGAKAFRHRAGGVRHARHRHRPRAHRARPRRGRLPHRQGRGDPDRLAGRRGRPLHGRGRRSRRRARLRRQPEGHRGACATRARCSPQGTGEHDYPHCWRCKQPGDLPRHRAVLHRAHPGRRAARPHSTCARARSPRSHKATWVPPWGEARIAGMVENRFEWCVSRQRRWGSPITVLVCANPACRAIWPDGSRPRRPRAHSSLGVEELFAARWRRRLVRPAACRVRPCGPRLPEVRRHRVARRSATSSTSGSTPAPRTSRCATTTASPGCTWPADVYVEAPRPVPRLVPVLAAGRRRDARRRAVPGRRRARSRARRHRQEDVQVARQRRSRRIERDQQVRRRRPASLGRIGRLPRGHAVLQRDDHPHRRGLSQGAQHLALPALQPLRFRPCTERAAARFAPAGGRLLPASRQAARGAHRTGVPRLRVPRRLPRTQQLLRGGSVGRLPRRSSRTACTARSPDSTAAALGADGASPPRAACSRRRWRRCCHSPPTRCGTHLPGATPGRRAPRDVRPVAPTCPRTTAADAAFARLLELRERDPTRSSRSTGKRASSASRSRPSVVLGGDRSGAGRRPRGHAGRRSRSCASSRRWPAARARWRRRPTPACRVGVRRAEGTTCPRCWQVWPKPAGHPAPPRAVRPLPRRGARPGGAVEHEASRGALADRGGRGVRPAHQGVDRRRRTRWARELRDDPGAFPARARAKPRHRVRPARRLRTDGPDSRC